MRKEINIEIVCDECENIIKTKIPKRICSGFVKKIKCNSCKFSLDFETAHYPLDEKGHRI